MGTTQASKGGTHENVYINCFPRLVEATKPCCYKSTEEHKSGGSSMTTKVCSSDSTVMAVCYYAPADRTNQMGLHARSQERNTQCLAHSWRQDNSSSDKYKSYWTLFYHLLSDISNMWVSHIGRIDTAEHQVKLHKSSTRSYTLHLIAPLQWPANPEKSKLTKCQTRAPSNPHRRNDLHPY